MAKSFGQSFAETLPQGFTIRNQMAATNIQGQMMQIQKQHATLEQYKTFSEILKMPNTTREFLLPKMMRTFQIDPKSDDGKEFMSFVKKADAEQLKMASDMMTSLGLKNVPPKLALQLMNNPQAWTTFAKQYQQKEAMGTLRQIMQVPGQSTPSSQPVSGQTAPGQLDQKQTVPDYTATAPDALRQRATQILTASMIPGLDKQISAGLRAQASVLNSQAKGKEAKLPVGYQWMDPARPELGVLPIKGGPAMGKFEENAQRKTSFMQAKDYIKQIRGLIYPKWEKGDKTPDRTIMATMKQVGPISGVPFTKGRTVNTLIREFILKTLYATAGKQLSDFEIKTNMSLYTPSVGDTDEAILTKLQRMESKLAGSAEAFEPGKEYNWLFGTPGEQPSPTAPPAAIEWLRQNDSPEIRRQFQEKYGYLPEGM